MTARRAVAGIGKADFSALVLLLALAHPAHAQDRVIRIAPAPASEQRVALIIGISAYAQAPLKNPVNDATDIAATLRDVGFKVTLVKDVDRRAMRLAIRDFSHDLKRGGVGLFYFAGHGILSKGKNFLLPVGADVREEFDLEDQAIDANVVLAGMEEAGNRVNIVILDACRNNPFARAWRSAASGGLAQMNAPAGSFIAFATSPNSVAADGTGRNGIFTKHLLANLRQGDSDIDRVFTRVTAGVSRETGNRQIPWKSSSLTGMFQFREGEQRSGQIDPAERAAWEAVRNSSRPEDFDSFLRRYPSGYYSDLARDMKSQAQRVQEQKGSSQDVHVPPTF